MLPLLGLAAGLYIGSKISINNETLLGVGLLTTATLPLLGPTSLCVGLGLGVAGIVRNIIREKYNNKKSELEKVVVEAQEDSLYVGTEYYNEIQELNNSGVINKKDYIHRESVKAAQDSWWCFTSTLTFTAIPLQLLTLVQGLSSLLMPISVITLIVKAYTYILDNPSKAARNAVLTSAVAFGAFTAITNVASGGMLTYFMALITIPSLLLNKKVDTNNTNKKDKENIYDPNNFLYGGSTNNTSIIGTAIVLGQTILWGSGKDVLGTIINGDASILLDPMRLSILGVVIGWLFLVGKSNYIQTITSKLNNNKSNNNNNLLENILKIISVIYCLINYSPLLVGGLIIGGLILNTLDKHNIVRNVSIPMLLIVGVLTSF